MKKWMTLIELIVVMGILATLMTVWTLRISVTQNNQQSKQDIINIYNTFNTHNNNISRWKSWSVERILDWRWDEMTWLTINREGLAPIIISWENLSFSYCSWTVTLWKNIRHSLDCMGDSTPPKSTIYICDKKNITCTWWNIVAEITFTETINTISLIRTWKFIKYN